MKSMEKTLVSSGPSPISAGTAKDRRVAEAVLALATPVCQAEGAELIQVVFRRENAGRVLRLFIDKPGGVTLEDCAAVSRQVDDLLEVSLDDIGPYSLEVSSPGAERPLVRPEDFDRFKDCRARITMARPVEGRKTFTGILLGLADGRLRLRVDNRTVDLPYGEIARAQLAVPPPA